MPLLPPVITATLPSSLPMMVLLCDGMRSQLFILYRTIQMWRVASKAHIYLPKGIDKHPISMEQKKSARALGRPRSFETGKALDAAMKVCWCKGYEGASLSDLTRAMGINRPSLYAAFGDKESLFRKVLDRYDSGPAAYVQEAMHQPTARAVVQRLMEGAADLATASGNPRGCLFVQSALACGDKAEGIRNDLILRRDAGEKAVRLRLKRAQAEGDLPRDANTADLARYVVTVIQGIAVQAAGGATRNELRRVIENALRAWPQ